VKNLFRVLNERSKVFYGTTTVGIRVRDGVVFAADTRVTSGSYIAHRHGKKLYEITPYVAMTIAGVVADAQNVIDILRYHARLYEIERMKRISVRTISTLASNVFTFYRLFPLITQVLIGGYDERPSLYQIDFFGSLAEEQFVSTGSGSPISLGLLETSYREDLSIEECLALAARSVLLAMRRDAASGDDIDIAYVDQGGLKFLSAEEKRRLIERVSKGLG